MIKHVCELDTECTVLSCQLCSPPSTSTSSSSIIPSTTPKLSRNPLTATLNMRFVVALYSVRNMVFSCSSSINSILSFSAPTVPFVVRLLVASRGDGVAREKVRNTSGESSASTWRARRAESARRWVGKGVSIVLSHQSVLYSIESGSEGTMSKGRRDRLSDPPSSMRMEADDVQERTARRSHRREGGAGWDFPDSIATRCP